MNFKFVKIYMYRVKVYFQRINFILFKKMKQKLSTTLKVIII